MHTNYTTDNRWSPGSSGATIPTTAPAAYAARWISHGYTTLADVVPDRQGFAYNDEADRDRLRTKLSEAGDELRVPSFMDLPRDESTDVVSRDGFNIAYRQAGGYIYVDAWLTLAHDSTCGTCGRTWNSVETPTPAARCPFEYDHDVSEPETTGHVVEVPMLITEMPERTWQVWCLDGAIRHEGTFDTLVKAREWADTGHVCAKAHTFVEVWS